MKKIRKRAYELLVLLSFIIALFEIVYLRHIGVIPDKVPLHWNLEGKVDSYGVWWNLVLFPSTILLMFIFMRILPKIDPLRKNYGAFMEEFRTFLAVFSILILVLENYVIVYAKGIKLSSFIFFSVILALLFYISAMVLEKSKRNWFVGIRTPWTLTSDLIWEKTNKLAAKLFKISAVILLISGISDVFFFSAIFLVIILVGILPVVYSFYLWVKINKEN